MGNSNSQPHHFGSIHEKNEIGKIRPGYYKNKEAVYYGGKQMHGADPKTFMSIRFGYAIDFNCVYYKGKCIPNIDDPKKFTIINAHKIDKSVPYKLQKINERKVVGRYLNNYYVDGMLFKT
jgi:hypothetical protein